MCHLCPTWYFDTLALGNVIHVVGVMFVGYMIYVINKAEEIIYNVHLIRNGYNLYTNSSFTMTKN